MANLFHLLVAPGERGEIFLRLRRGEDFAVGPVERFLLDGAHRREPAFAVAAAELVRAVVDEQQYCLRRHAETVVYAEKRVEIGARERVAEHALALSEQRAERSVVGAAAQNVLRAVDRQLVRSRQRRVPGGEKARPGEPPRRRADLLRGAGEGARCRRGIEHAAGAQNIKIQQRALPVAEREELFGVLRRKREHIRALNAIAFSVHVRPLGVYSPIIYVYRILYHNVST